MEDQNVTYSQSSSITPIELRSKEMDLESGILGKIFGNNKNAPSNIAGIALLLLILPGAVLIFCSGSITAIDYWKLITPILTLVLGYIFGRSP